jgi:plastocyanin
MLPEVEEADLKRPFLMVIVVGALAYASVASAAPTQIQVGDNFFAPRTPPARNLSAGASFQWQRALGGNPHNVRQDFKLFYSGGTTSGPINFSVSASAGTYHYYCELHRSFGMDGVVKVRPVFAANPAGAPFTVRWALSDTTTGTRFDVRFRVGVAGPWRLWRNDTSGRSGVFGRNGQPVRVVSGRTYQFQARSQKVSTQPSGWSPTLTVRT